MKLHEYQAKGLFRDYGVSVPDGIVAETVDAAVDAARRLEEENDATLFIVKAQIHAGGRGKGAASSSPTASRRSASTPTTFWAWTW
jgi:succinyl-CoA synthetase (ADP-forming) beta subunit (EC 6.2.1.5)